MELAENSVNISDAARIAGVVEGTIRHAIGRGELIPIREARPRLLSISDVEAWSEVERKRGPKPKADCQPG